MNFLDSYNRKGEKERERVKNIGQEYEAISELLGINSRRINKVHILKQALEYIYKHSGEELQNAMPTTMVHH